MKKTYRFSIGLLMLSAFVPAFIAGRHDAPWIVVVGIMMGVVCAYIAGLTDGRVK